MTNLGASQSDGYTPGQRGRWPLRDVTVEHVELQDTGVVVGNPHVAEKDRMWAAARCIKQIGPVTFNLPVLQHVEAACPAHDVAFDSGMLTVNGGLRIHLARPLVQAVRNDPLARQYYGRPPLREVLLLPEGAQARALKYLDWHRRKVFVA